MPSILDVIDGGVTTIKHKDRNVQVGVIKLVAQERESNPVEIVGLCNLFFKHKIINTIRQVTWLDNKAVPKQSGQQDNKESPSNGSIDG